MTGIEFHCIESQQPSHASRVPRAEARSGADFAQNDAFAGPFGCLELQSRRPEARWIQKCADARPILTSANFQRLYGLYLSDLSDLT
jgi:hypothetical protein